MNFITSSLPLSILSGYGLYLVVDFFMAIHRLRRTNKFIKKVKSTESTYSPKLPELKAQLHFNCFGTEVEIFEACEIC